MRARARSDGGRAGLWACTCVSAAAREHRRAGHAHRRSCWPRGKSHRTACTRGGRTRSMPRKLRAGARQRARATCVRTYIYCRRVHTSARAEEKTGEERKKGVGAQLPGCWFIGLRIRETEFSPMPRLIKTPVLFSQLLEDSPNFGIVSRELEIFSRKCQTYVYT